MINALRFAGGLLGLSGIVITFLYGASAGEPDLVRRLTIFFSTLTILTNTIVTIAFLLPALVPNTQAGRFFAHPAVRTAIAGYIIIVGVAYYIFLSQLSDPQGMAQIANNITHYIIPVVFVLDWLFLTAGKGSLAWFNGGRSLIYPIIYTIWMLLHGALTGWYPYPFVDVKVLGYPQTLINIAGFIVVFVVIQWLLVALGRLIGRQQQVALS